LEIIATSIMIVISLIGCNTSQFSSYSADIGDSMLIYIEKFPSDMKKNILVLSQSIIIIGILAMTITWIMIV